MLVILGSIDGWDAGDGEPAAAPQRDPQLRHGVVADLGDVLVAGVHVGDLLHLGDLLRGQPLAEHGAVVIQPHGDAAPVLTVQLTVPVLSTDNGFCVY